MDGFSAIFTFLFWTCAGLVGYSYLLYPVVLWCLSKLRIAPIASAQPGDPPAVSLLIVAHNEADVIEARLKNALSLDYPSNKLEIVVASDGSTDSTGDIVRRYHDQGVRLIEFHPQRGKAAVLNRSIPQLSNDIVALSDANTELDPSALRRLTGWFSDSAVGAVCGRLILTDPTSGRNADGLYWKYETLLKQCEARLDSLLGANGAIYAIRRAGFVPLPDNMIVEDFIIPLLARLHHGYAIRYDMDAVAREETAADLREEFRRRCRIGAGNFQSIALLWRLLDPRLGFVAIAFFSHKLLRWFCPFFLLGILAASVVLIRHPFYRLALIAQLAAYLLAGLATVAAGELWMPKAVRLVTLFVSMNAALLVGFFRWILGSDQPGWQPTGRATDHAAITRPRPMT